MTFLFTDIEGSTRRWETDADAMRAALLAHDEVLRTAIESYDGFLFSHTGDGVVAAFFRRRPLDAALTAQRRLSCRCAWASPRKPTAHRITGTVSTGRTHGHRARRSDRWRPTAGLLGGYRITGIV